MEVKVRNPFLGNEEWLREHYEINLLTTYEIAALAGCTASGVRIALLRFGIPLRKSCDSIVAAFDRKGRQSKKYPLLNDRVWLSHRYNVEMASLEDIAREVGAKNHNSVRQALMRFGIAIRSVSDGLTCKRQDDGFILKEDVIVGGLLGDASMRRYSHTGESFPSFRRKNKHFDHVSYVSKELFGSLGSSRIKKVYDRCRGKVFPQYKLTSLSHKELSPLYEKWYPETSDRKKVVPEDLDLTPTVLLHWFLDDGSTSWRVRKTKTNVVLVFCSESFTKDEQQLLCDKMNLRYDFRSKVVVANSGTGWRIKIPESKTQEFFAVIGDCPAGVPSMNYKWKEPHAD